MQEADQEMYTPETPINTDAITDISSVSPSQVMISPTVSLINHASDDTLPMASATSAQLQPAMPSNEIQTRPILSVGSNNTARNQYWKDYQQLKETLEIIIQALSPPMKNNIFYNKIKDRPIQEI